MQSKPKETKVYKGVKLSITSKLDGIRSWSLNALETCSGSVDANGELVDACKGCYATTGNYNFPNVRAPRDHNKIDWTRLEWVDDMVKALGNDRFFRWFDSGDIYTLALGEKILEIMVRTPWVQHWLPTRMHKFPKYKGLFLKMKKLPNVSVRFSSDSVQGEFLENLHGSVIIPTVNDIKPNLFLCQAYAHEGKCNGCRACFNKDIPVIAYPAHGVKMQKIIKLIRAA
jgi:hypothetical protein